MHKKQQAMIDLFSTAPMKKTFAMTLDYNQQGQAVLSMPYQDKFNHALGAMHGGVLSTLLDNAGWFTAITHFDHWIVTTNLNVQLCRPTSGSGLTAFGRLVKSGRQLAFATMECMDDNQQLIAHGSATFSVTNHPVDQMTFKDRMTGV
jgi:uncharacterized protein (TIGR00369 family)